MRKRGSTGFFILTNMTLDEKTLMQWLQGWKNRGSLYPPGIVSDFVESPNCTIGLVHSHRLVFYFWSNFNKKYSEGRATSTQNRPLFVSIDFHNDSGVERDFDKAEIEGISTSDDLALSLYCWLRLPPGNDGQILPALYLNSFSDAYILLKKKFYRKCEDVYDKNNKRHSIKYFKKLDELIVELQQISGHPIYLDIDLDYFVTKDSGDYRGGKLVPDDEFRNILKLKRELMKILYPNLVGLTIALEPECCGGMKNSLHVLSILNGEFFCGFLFTEKCNWNI